MNDNTRHPVYDDEAFWIMEKFPHDYDPLFVRDLMAMRSECFIERKFLILSNFLWFVKFGYTMKQAEIMTRRIELVENNRN